MCDTFVALPDTTVNGDIIFGEILSSLFLCSGVGHYGKLLHVYVTVHQSNRTEVLHYSQSATNSAFF